MLPADHAGALGQAAGRSFVVAHMATVRQVCLVQLLLKFRPAGTGDAAGAAVTTTVYIVFL